MAIRVITFDLDDTLWDVRTVIGNAERAMRNRLEASAPGVLAVFDDGRGQLIRERVARERPEIAHDLSALRETVVHEALLEAGVSQGSARLIARDAFETFLAARHEVTFFDEVLPTLARLGDRFVMGALSNGNADPARLGLGRFLTFSFSAAAVGAAKPAPAMFQAALAHTGVAPFEAIHVGDHPTDDIGGAAAVGMHTIWFNQRAREWPTSAAPSREVRRFEDLVAAVAEIDAG
jgi:putative hydrolase of the HAD superfamily